MLKDHGILFGRLLSSERNRKPPLGDKERSVAQSAYISASNKINANQESGMIGIDDCDIDDAARLDEKIETFLVKFERVVEYFKNSSRAKDNFLQCFHSWSQHCKTSVRELREMAAELRALKNENDFTRLEGNVYGAVFGGLLLTLPFWPAVGIVGGICSLMVNTTSAIVTCDEISVVKRKLKRAVDIIEEEKKRYSAMQWFSCHEEQEKALNSFVSSSVLKQMAQKVESFRKITNQKDMTEDEFKNHYEDVLDYCMEKMAQESKLIKEYGKELAPVVMSFIFVVCLMNDHNRIVLDYSLTTLHLTSAWNCGAIVGLAMGAFVFESAVKLVSVCLGVAINVLLAAYSFINAHKRIDSEHARKIEEAADKIEEIFEYIEKIYNETKKYKSHDEVAGWKSILVSQTPDDATSDDLKKAVKLYLPEVARDRIRLLKFETKENDWLVMVPANHSQRLLQLKQIEIKEKICKVSGS